MDYKCLRETLIRHFHGRGLDIGPFNSPFIHEPDSYGLVVETVDRWPPEELKKLFPEIADAENLPKPNYVWDVSANGLGFSPDAVYDFVICSHVVEHMADPFFLIEECFRVAVPGGIVYFGVPDCRHSFDWGRKLTRFEYLLDKYRRRVRQPSMEDLLDYLRSPTISKVEHVAAALKENRVDRGFYEHECRRSFHVHVWDSYTFLDHIFRFLKEARQATELVDLYLTENNGYETVILLRKSTCFQPDVLARHVRSSLQLRSSEACYKPTPPKT